MEQDIQVEIAVQDLAGVRTALAAGADRIELCVALELGGLTPSAGLIAGAVELAAEQGRSDFVHVLVRSRPGDFLYDAEELRLLRSEIAQAIRLGADGVVVGALRANDRGAFAQDRDALAGFIEAAGESSVTFHRAFDLIVGGSDGGTVDESAAIAAATELASAGVRRVLTSGGAPRVGDGLQMLAALAAARTGLEIMAGGGAAVPDIARLAAYGVDAVHLSARRIVEGSATGPGGGAATYSLTDAELVAAAVAEACSALRNAGSLLSSGLAE